MNKDKIRDFFNEWSVRWDDDMVKDDTIMNVILDSAGVNKDSDVLDVACGTGVMIDYYLERDVNSVTGVDLSDKMCAIAEGKFSDDQRVRIICADIEEFESDSKYDAIVVYNSFPHFPDGERLVVLLAGLLKAGGRLTIAHGMSRERINSHHSNVSDDIRRDLMSAEELSAVFSRYLEVKDVISDERMYMVTGVKA